MICADITDADVQKWINVDRARDMINPSSRVIKNKETGTVVMETFSRSVAAKINKSTFEAVPIRQHLESLNDHSVAFN
jgi:hypothetical protein